jgi:hypothetical protein
MLMTEMITLTKRHAIWLALLFAVTAVIFSGCSKNGDYTKAEIACGKAAYAVSGHLPYGDDYVTNNFGITRAEYIDVQDDNGEYYKIVLKCSLQLKYTRNGADTYANETHVYLIGEGDAFLKSLGVDTLYIKDDATGLYLADFGDYTLTEYKDNEVNTSNILKIFNSDWANKKR